MKFLSPVTYLKRGIILGLIGLITGFIVGSLLGLPIVGWNYIPTALELTPELQKYFIIALLIMSVVWGYIATWVVEKIG